MKRRIVVVLMIGVMAIVTSCQFRANREIWNVAEVDGEWIEYVTNHDTSIKSWRLFENQNQNAALPDTFTRIEFTKDGKLVVGLVFEQENPLYFQGMPAFFDAETNTLKSCPDAPLFWDISVHSTNEDTVLVIGDTFIGLILYDIKSCQTLKVIQEQEQLRSLAGISWNAEKELLAYSRKNDEGVSQIISIDLDGDQREVLGQGMYPSWSPDGEQIAFAADSKTIIVKCLEDSEKETFLLPERLTLHQDKFSWSPDGTRIVFSVENKVSDRKTNFVIYTINLVTSKVEFLGIEGRSPVWAYD